MLPAQIEAVERRTLVSATLLPDPSFGGGRVVLNAEDMQTYGQAVHPLPDGDVLVAGRAVRRAAAGSTGEAGRGVIVGRYNADGSLDAAFGGGGWVFLERLTDAYALTAQPDGKVVVAGRYYPYTGRSDDDFASQFAAARLNADGSPDASFGVDGDVTVDFPGGLDTAFDVTLDPAGNVVLVGSTLVPSTRTASPSVAPRALYVGSRRLAVARLTPAGALDATFDGDGMAMPQASGENNGGSAVVALAGGDVVVGGSGSEGAFVLKLRADGSLDPSFGANGATSLPRVAGVADLVLLSDGDLLAVGGGIHEPAVDPRDPEAVHNTPARMALARLNPDGSLDAAFGAGGVVVEEARLTYYYFMDLTARELADGTLAVGGADYHYAYAAVFGADGTKRKAAVSDRTDFGGHPAVALQADGKLLVTGHTVGADPTAMVTARYELTEEPEQPQAEPLILSSALLGRPVRGGRFYLFRVAYRVADGFDVNTLRARDALQVVGPTGDTHDARLLRHNRFRRGNIVIGLYRMLAPGGVFDAGDAGRYAVRLGPPLAAQVAGGSTTVGTFDVPARRRAAVNAAQAAMPK
jgi:uncharacterized delta-60 repeat protein